MNLFKSIKEDRIGPDIFWTHWMLRFKWSHKLIRKKIGEFHESVEIRPYSTIVGTKNVKLGKNVVIRSGTQIHCNSNDSDVKIIVEDDVLIAPNVFITTNNHLYKNIETPIIFQGGESDSIIIKTGSWIGVNSVILKGTIIGKNSVVAAGSIVTRSVPDYSLVAGVPAKIIKKFIDGEWRDVK
ncbi:acyltransferase [Clostridium sp. Sa3CUN1]|uniref:Acyltransferase n=1 Tax=Clostridium gallinarum TaxID=2762246 RepID=A0ABR8Q5F5_9CLOT|nr:acyltransferase [Clostridium gallinarum]MBD7915653.1 acyltransferase [Clostridium gallinarum]